MVLGENRKCQRAMFDRFSGGSQYLYEGGISLEKSGGIMTSLKIRKAQLEDLPELNRVLRASKGHWGYSQAYLDEFMEKLGVTENCIANYQIFCVNVDDQFVGFYGFRKNEDDKDELDFFFLDPRYIGKGIGLLMWDSCLDTAKTLGIKDFVLNSEPNAETFYLKLGCKKIGYKKSVVSWETRSIPIMSYSLEATHRE